MSLINEALKRARQTHQQQAATLARPMEPALEPARPEKRSRMHQDRIVLWILPLCLAGCLLLGAWMLHVWMNAGIQEPSSATNHGILKEVQQAIAAGETKPSRPIQPSSVEPVPTPTESGTSTAQASAGPKAALGDQASRPSSDKPASAGAGVPQASDTASIPAPARPSSTSAAQATPSLTTPKAEVQQDPVPGGAQPETQSGAKAETTAETAQSGVASGAPPSSTPPDDFPALKLQGIYYRLSGPSALINGRLLHEGSMVSGAQVISIERTEVIVEWKGYQKELMF